MIHVYLNPYKTPDCKVICTEIVTQEFRELPGDQIVSELLQNQTSPVPLFLSGGRDSQAVAQNVTFCGVSDTQTCGEIRVLFVPGQPSAEIVRVGWANMWQNANLVGPGAPPSHEMRVNRQNLV